MRLCLFLLIPQGLQLAICRETLQEMHGLHGHSVPGPRATLHGHQGPANVLAVVAAERPDRGCHGGSRRVAVSSSGGIRNSAFCRCQQQCI